MTKRSTKLRIVNPNALTVDHPGNRLTLDDGFEIDTARLSDDEYQQALRIGISTMLGDGLLLPSAIASHRTITRL